MLAGYCRGGSVGWLKNSFSVVYWCLVIQSFLILDASIAYVLGNGFCLTKSALLHPPHCSQVLGEPRSCLILLLQLIRNNLQTHCFESQSRQRKSAIQSCFLVSKRNNDSTSISTRTFPWLIIKLNYHTSTRYISVMLRPRLFPHKRRQTGMESRMNCLQWRLQYRPCG